MVVAAAPTMLPIASTAELAALAVALGAREVSGWSAAEESLTAYLPPPAPDTVAAARAAIEQGGDPLGDAFSRLLSAEQRRPLGATYTPAPIVDAMLAWAGTQVHPARVIDPGVGSARFLVAAGRAFPLAHLVGVDVDPLAALLARGHLAAAGLAGRASVAVRDFRDAPLPPIDGRTLYLGNPPYVRHHLIDGRWKGWLVDIARKHGLRASQLAGLHVHFFLAIAETARPGDVGVLITAAEWLDVNYGRLVRELLLGPLGARNLQIIEPAAMPFPGTATTAVITGFEVGARPPTIGLRRVDALDRLGKLEADWQIRRERLLDAPRWTPLTRVAPERREGFVELGELCRVHRGQVTGANRVWIAGLHSAELPESVLFPAVTKARELFGTDGALTDAARLRRVIDLPIDLDRFDSEERRAVDRFLRVAKALGADSGFIARHRKAWWSVGLRPPAPILATYMARRPPAFVRNLAAARHINIAHGLYPREPLPEPALGALAAYLSRSATTDLGRTYAGGLTKFEPREMERLLVPHPASLADGSWTEAFA
jgi:adenine-specific DNA-methyltransferase